MCVDLFARIKDRLRLDWAASARGRRNGAAGGVTKLRIDPRRGTWRAKVEGTDLEQLTNPVEATLTVGEDSGGERLLMRETIRRWTYER